MINNAFAKQTLTKIVDALDHMMHAAAWNESNFIKIIGKKIHEIRTECADNISVLEQNDSSIFSHLANRVAVRSGQREIFIGLYSVDGSNLRSWERIIANLPHQIIARPIYADETDVKSIIKTKDNKNNEAYVSIYVSQNDILTLDADKVPVDKLGKQLLTLKNTAIKLDNIHFFCYQSNLYQYVRGHLIKTTVDK